MGCGHPPRPRPQLLLPDHRILGTKWGGIRIIITAALNVISFALNLFALPGLRHNPADPPGANLRKALITLIKRMPG